MTKTLTVSKVAKPQKTITFYSLLEKYGGDIRKAKPSELRRVSPNGIGNLLKAWRLYERSRNEAN